MGRVTRPAWWDRPGLGRAPVRVPRLPGGKYSLALLADGGSESPRPRGIDWTPERRLMAAVLLAAVDDIQGNVGRQLMKGDRHRNTWRVTAVAWVRDQLAPESWPYGFAAVCEGVGLEPDAVRRALGL